MAARRQVAPTSMAFTFARRRVEGGTSGATGVGGGGGEAPSANSPTGSGNAPHAVRRRKASAVNGGACWEEAGG
eukprot:11242235-Alexandrium_andersonii.AAC.1